VVEKLREKLSFEGSLAHQSALGPPKTGRERLPKAVEDKREKAGSSVERNGRREN
jgi:hypothetical protein